MIINNILVIDTKKSGMKGPVDKLGTKSSKPIKCIFFKINNLFSYIFFFNVNYGYTNNK